MHMKAQDNLTAEQIGRTPAAVAGLLHRGLEALRARLDEHP